ncbi:MAG: type II toxin-antitoxin system RelE/ParE family toxin [Accumulibacter sp.]|uniref:type II toxin-antitoxin system RelE/ParE family toxin n=1 Tax=Accumulibacter sp. TaxID=2053492 RepID=UPI003315BC55
MVSFRHKGLEAFFCSGTQAGIQQIHAKRLREMLTALHAAASRDDLARPSWRLHGLFGDRVGFLAMTV